MAIYARENGQGMAFEATDTLIVDDDVEAAETAAQVEPTGTPTPPAGPAASDPHQVGSYLLSSTQTPSQAPSGALGGFCFRYSQRSM